MANSNPSNNGMRFFKVIKEEKPETRFYYQFVNDFVWIDTLLWCEVSLKIHKTTLIVNAPMILSEIKSCYDVKSLNLLNDIISKIHKTTVIVNVPMILFEMISC